MNCRRCRSADAMKRWVADDREVRMCADCWDRYMAIRPQVVATSPPATPRDTTEREPHANQHYRGRVDT